MNNSSKNYTANFANKLRALRTEKEITQKEVAQAMGISESTYANWEQGRREPSINDIYKIIEFFDIDANELFDK